MGPGQYPRYTRAPFGEEAVGSPQSTHHRAPQAQPMSQRQHPTRDESLAKKGGHSSGFFASTLNRSVHTSFYAGLRETTCCVPFVFDPCIDSMHHSTPCDAYRKRVLTPWPQTKRSQQDLFFVGPSHLLQGIHDKTRKKQIVKQQGWCSLPTRRRYNPHSDLSSQVSLA